MPRNPRVHYARASYHVMLQGNYRQNIFYSPEDYLFFYKILEKSVRQYNFKIHLFCIMTNHIHLLIEIKHIPLRKIMQTIASRYSKYLNKKMNRHGHLFRGRYLDKIIEDDRYMMELCYYIHMNPLKAKMVKNLDSYPWSSHHSYKNRNTISWLTTDKFDRMLKERFGKNYAYDIFLRDDDRYYAEPKFCQFDKNGVLTIECESKKLIYTLDGLSLNILTLKEIIGVICDYFGITLHRLRSASKEDLVTMARTLVVYYAHYYAEYKISHIAPVLGFRADSLSKTMHRQLSSQKKRDKLDLKIESLDCEFLELIRRKKKSDIGSCE